MAQYADLVFSLPFLFSGLEDSGPHTGDSASGPRGMPMAMIKGYSRVVSRMGDILLTRQPLGALLRWPSQEGTAVVLTTRNFYKTP